jgi:hypothetical protein
MLGDVSLGSNKLPHCLNAPIAVMLILIVIILLFRQVDNKFLKCCAFLYIFSMGVKCTVTRFEVWITFYDLVNILVYFKGLRLIRDHIKRPLLIRKFV